MRVPSRAECGVLGARSHCELVEIRLADHDRSGVVELGDDGGVIGRAPAIEDLRRARRRDPASAHVVLQGDRHPGQRSGISTDGNRLVDLVGPGTSFVGEHQVEGVDICLAFVDRCKMTGEHVVGARQVVANVPGDVGGAGRELVAHAQSSSPTIGGTLKRPSSAAGAAASTSSRSRQSISMSSRMTLAIGVGCVIGSTPSRSSASMSAK